MYAFKAWIKGVGSAETAEVFVANSANGAVSQFVSALVERDGLEKADLTVMTMSDGYFHVQEHIVKARWVLDVRFYDNCGCRYGMHFEGCRHYRIPF